MGWSWQSVKMANRIYCSISRFVWWHGFEIVTIDFRTQFTIVETVKTQIVTLRIHSIGLIVVRPPRSVLRSGQLVVYTAHGHSVYNIHCTVHPIVCFKVLPWWRSHLYVYALCLVRPGRDGLSVVSLRRAIYPKGRDDWIIFRSDTGAGNKTQGMYPFL